MSTILNYEIEPIGFIDTPFQQKFAIPRQGNGLSVAKGQITFASHINTEQALAGIEDFSHLWILFLFHDNLAHGFKDKVRPPRLGGNKKVGVFASRSSFRPNGIGMSLVKNLGVHNNKLHLGAVDLLNQTPIVDIKPYLPYADIEATASSGYAPQKPTLHLNVVYTNEALAFIESTATNYPDFLLLLESILAQDPRPAYKQSKFDDKTYHLSLYDVDVHWRMEPQRGQQLEQQSNNPRILVLKMNKV